MKSEKKIVLCSSDSSTRGVWRERVRAVLSLDKKILTRFGLACLTAASMSAGAAQPDNPQAAAVVDRGALAAEVFETWANFRVPGDARNSTPWGVIDLNAWIKAATVEQLTAARMATTFDGVVRALRSGTSKVTGAVVLAAGQPVTTSALGSLTSDLVYTPVTPCRIIDTRLPTPAILGPNNGRQFGIVSTDYSAQGGQAASCGIPANVSAVAINVVSTGQTGIGNLKIVETWGGLPNASFLNYQQGVNLANAGISKVAFVSSTEGLYIHSTNSASHAVVDIMGYFSPGSQQAVSTETSGGALTLANAPVICQVSFTPTQNWTARPTSAVSLLADSAGSLGWGSYFVYSTDGGATWNFSSAIWVIRGGAPASTWGYSSTNPVDVLSLSSGTNYLFGIKVIRYTGTGNSTDSRCGLRVALE